MISNNSIGSVCSSRSTSTNSCSKDDGVINAILGILIMPVVEVLLEAPIVAAVKCVIIITIIVTLVVPLLVVVSSTRSTTTQY